MDAADRPERNHGGMRCAARLPLSAARSRHQVYPVLPSDHCVRSSPTAGAAGAQPDPEFPCGAMGQVGDGRLTGGGWGGFVYWDKRKVGGRGTPKRLLRHRASAYSKSTQALAAIERCGLLSRTF